MAKIDGFNWHEYVEDNGPGEVSFEPDGARAKMVINVVWDDAYPVTKRLLGYSYRVIAGDDAHGVLKRVLPAAHPRYPWLYCTRVSPIVGMGPTGKEELYPSPALEAASKYDMARLTLDFNTLPYDVLEDDDADVVADGEWRRYTDKRFETGSEGLNLQQGEYRFAEGATIGADGSRIPIPGGKNRIVSTQTLRWTWMQIPHACIFNSDGYDSNIFPLVGSVNDAVFAGRPAGTLLCLPPKYIPMTAPLAPGDVGATNRIWNVEFNFLFKDPPTAGPTHGHNLAPIPGNADGLWAYFTADGTAGAASVYPKKDWSKMFRSR